MKNGNTEIKRGGKRIGAGRKKLAPDQKRVSITLRLSKEKFDRLSNLAKNLGRTKTSVIEYGIGCLRMSSEIPQRRRKPMPAGNLIIDV